MEWDKWGLFISLVTPLILGIGAWINDAVTKKKKDNTPRIEQGMTVDYETDYITLLKANLADAHKEIKELKRQVRMLQNPRRNNGNSDYTPEE